MPRRATRWLCIVAHGSDGFQGHVSGSLVGPFIVLLKQEDRLDWYPRGRSFYRITRLASLCNPSRICPATTRPNHWNSSILHSTHRIGIRRPSSRRKRPESNSCLRSSSFSATDRTTCRRVVPGPSARGVDRPLDGLEAVAH